MSGTAVEARHLSKTFQLPAEGEQPARHLRDAITRQVRQLLVAREKRPMRSFAALDNVSFTIRQGERVGLLGLNGAGKSTLIKILSGITKPSSGEAEIRGRVGTLLEIGLGFHDEMSGRENIYLMGALYGMQREEIHGQFDSIVSFAGVEDFLHTPVKHYSTGMRARLGFSVAAHLRCDVLLMDEALAVGDVLFRERCLRKMYEISQDGRTVVLVSHSESAIRQFCNRALLLEKGRLILDSADVEEALAQCRESTPGN